MGFGDPDHRHPLKFHRLKNNEANCFRCELPIEEFDWCYGCPRCYHFLHKFCAELPLIISHRLHPHHSLTLLVPNTSQNTTTALCDECHNPCFSHKYTYHCQTCLEFHLHLKCFLNLNLKIKHQHPLSLCEFGYSDEGELACRICGLFIDDGLSFGCKVCRFYIHFKCTFLPLTVNHHHQHELTFNYNYPKNCDLSYCDVCEDKDDKELDRTLSYYYCESCEYIAHVHCVITQPDIANPQLKFFFHDHPLIYGKKSWHVKRNCAVCKRLAYGSLCWCRQCEYVLHKSCAEFPRFIKHPRHKQHPLELQSFTNKSLDLVVCNYCDGQINDDALFLRCEDCNYNEHLDCATSFSHPYYGDRLVFTASNGTKFRCNACGELGDGYSMTGGDNYHLHLECFALPGKIDHYGHSHSLYLISSPKKLASYVLPMCRCDVCHMEADSDTWVYCCKHCNYIGHLKCVAGELLLALQASNNCLNLCTISECDKGSFSIDSDAEMYKTMCLLLSTSWVATGPARPIFIDSYFCKGRELQSRDRNNQLSIQDVADVEESETSLLHCPKCERSIFVKTCSSISNWIFCNEENNIFTNYDQTSADTDPLTSLDEKLVDQLYCPICMLLIFPPTYSCAECQIFFHKSCAELPRKYTKDPGHTFELLPPSLQIENYSKCTHCDRDFKGYAYVCKKCEISLDVRCALGAPILNVLNVKHILCSSRATPIRENCRACGDHINDGNICFTCGLPDCLTPYCKIDNCRFYLHVECALLPFVVKHRIHQHPLVLESHLDLAVDDYVCDACEKELNPNVWVYRCSDSCGDRATSHVTCIVMSKKKGYFRYDLECSYKSIKEYEFDGLRSNELVKELEEKLSMDGGDH